MIPHSDAGAPSIERGVLSRMKRLDPNLVVTWHRYSTDPISGRPLLHNNRPVADPSYYLWRRDDNSRHHHWISFYVHFGQRQVQRLEGDLARFMRPTEILQKMGEARTARLAREKAQLQDTQNEKIKANHRRIGDLVFNGKSGQRQAKSFSASGLSRRGTPGVILKDAREDGWELNEDPGEQQ